MKYITVNMATEHMPYVAATYRNREGIRALRQLPGKNFALDNRGYPLTNRLKVPWQEAERKQEAINSLVNDLYGINGFLRRLLNIKRREELAGELLRLSPNTKNRKLLNIPPSIPSQEIEAKPVEIKDDDKKEHVELNMKLDMSSEAQAGRAFMAAKRKAFIQSRLIAPHKATFGIMGLLNADLAYSVTILTAFGMVHSDDAVRKSTVEVLGLLVDATQFEFSQAQKNPDSTTFTVQDLRDSTLNLDMIANALTSEGHGIFDSNDDVRKMSEAIRVNAANMFITMSRLLPKPDTTKRIIDPCKVVKS